MKVLLVAVVLACFVAYARSVSLEVNESGLILGDSNELFAAYMQKYNKVYSAEEYPLRFKNFQTTIQRVNEKNKRGNVVFGITKFSDMSTEEFKTTILMKNPITPKAVEKREAEAVSAVPANFDWRPLGAVTPVKDQEQCGSCWAFSATETIESAYIRANKATNTTIDLAPQQIVDCDTTDDGCDGGEPTSAYNYVIQAGGQDSEQSYPYQGVDGTCAFKAANVEAKITAWQYATSWLSETTMQTNLVGMGPLSICVDASSWQDYTSGILTHLECAFINILDHCVQLVGYNTSGSKPYWIVRNSWNTDWGIEGYIWLEMWQDTCGIAHEVTFPTV